MSISEFQLLESPISGNTIIEASAGTGKTYSIEGIYLRFLLQSFDPLETGNPPLEVGNILVVTYTEAATAELHERILSKIQNALSGFERLEKEIKIAPDLSKEAAEPILKFIDDDFLTKLILKFAFSTDGIYRHDVIGLMIGHLKVAIFSFDEAAIFTIHAFCRRMLSDYSLETKVGTEFEMLKDQSELIEHCINDYWRNQVYGTSDYSRFFIQLFPTPSKIQDYFLKILNRRDATLIPTIQVSGEEWFNNKKEDFKDLKEKWETQQSDVKALLEQFAGNFKPSYKKGIEDAIAKVNAFFSTNNPFGNLEGLVYFSSTKIENGTSTKNKVKLESPHHPIFEAFETYQKQVQAPEAQMAAIFGKDLVQELDQRKKTEGLTSFDDLLRLIKEALDSASAGTNLAEKIRHRFKAAMIDEFQDTDPVQYGIFHSLFHGHCPLFFIGDPKQSIYNFRGADIFAYFKAVQAASNRQLLKTNWRSDRDLVSAVNTIFEGDKQLDQFIYQDKISFTPSKGAENKPDRSLIVDGEFPAPFMFWTLKYEEKLKKGDVVKKITEGTVSEIVRLLNGSIKNEGDLSGDPKTGIQETVLENGEKVKKIRPIYPKDIAILVRTHNEAHDFQKALEKKNIPSVTKTTESIFQTHEFQQTHMLLQGIFSFNRDSTVKAALLTFYYGLSGEALFNLFRDEKEWESTINQFRAYHDIWLRNGFYPMMLKLMEDLNISQTILRFEGGERRLTNILQVIELIHQTQLEKKLNMEGTLRWMKHMIESPNDGGENEIRLETDRDSLKIMTLHASKGLEFPIVFCPSSWQAGSTDKTGIGFHDPVNDDRMTIDLIKSDSAKKLSAKERLAEEIRLTYVAFTRARNRCYTAWNKNFNIQSFNPKNSCYQHLFHRQEKDFEKSLNALKERSGQTIEIADLPEKTEVVYQNLVADGETLSCHSFDRKIKKSFGVYSFSGLNRSLEQLETDKGQDDEIKEKPEDSETVSLPVDPKELSIHSFPGGAQTGNFFHDILEHYSFANTKAETLKTLAENKSKQYQIDPKWLDISIEQVEYIRSMPLKSPYTTGESIVFSKIPDQQILKEMEFFFSIKGLDKASLSQVIKKHRGKGFDTILDLLEKIGTTELKGFMNGFIDMIFCYEDRYYILDWKSNKLGSGIEFYTAPYLLESMEHSHYNLQYFIYTIALHKYLKNRLHGYDFDQHFGGAYYIYLRGIEKGSTKHGVFYDAMKNGKALIEDLAGLF